MIDILKAINTVLPLLLIFVATTLGNTSKSNSLLRALNAFLLSNIVISLPTLYDLFYGLSSTKEQIEWMSFFRWDHLSTAMFLMVSIIGIIVTRFSKTYLKGDANYNDFFKKLSLTIGFVQLLIISGNTISLFICWVATSIALQQLILFYKDRKLAAQAAKKKFLVARLSDIALLIAFSFLYLAFDSVSLEKIFTAINTNSYDSSSIYIELAGLFLLLAAVIKSVQIPFHGWLLDVMEAPTPVSGLLHAGILNAGPFLIIRFSYLLELCEIAPIILLLIGGASALYGAIVFPTQAAIKTSLAYSSIGHMGFSLMICGMGLYSASLLHLIAHSFYKAHSFLSSGSGIDKYRLKQLNGTEKSQVKSWHIITGTLLSIALFMSVLRLIAWDHINNLQLLLLSSVMLAGVSSFIIKMLSSQRSLLTLIKTLVLAGTVLASFFFLETSMSAYLANQVPHTHQTALISSIVSLALLLVFLIVVVRSTIYQHDNVSISKWEIYRRNGFYIHLKFDHYLNKLYTRVRN